MSVYEEGKKRLAQMVQWKKTEAYEKMCITQNVQCVRLLDIGKSFLQNIHDLEENSKNIVARIEYATGGDIHRGVYCPSPILDIVIGNTHRGRLLKRVAATSNISHRFYFNTEGKLLFSESISGNNVFATEYIIERTDFRYGITINADYELDAISEEQYSDQKLVRYSYLNVYPDVDDYFCANLHTEQYAYDELGLKSCEEEDFEPFVKNFKKYKYIFDRFNGYLTEYTAIDCLLEDAGISSMNPLKYTVRFKRKA